MRPAKKYPIFALNIKVKRGSYKLSWHILVLMLSLFDIKDVILTTRDPFIIPKEPLKSYLSRKLDYKFN
jgi:hypothetical protein